MLPLVAGEIVGVGSGLQTPHNLKSRPSTAGDRAAWDYRFLLRSMESIVQPFKALRYYAIFIHPVPGKVKGRQGAQRGAGGNCSQGPNLQVSGQDQRVTTSDMPYMSMYSAEHLHIKEPLSVGCS